MRYCRFVLDGKAEYGLVESVAGRDEITRRLLKSPYSGTALEDLPSKQIASLPFAEAELLAPVQPSKIVCLGRNYGKHAAEMGHEVPKEPLIFLKPSSSIQDPGKPIRRPKLSQRTEYEGELGAIIGKRCYKLSAGEDVRPYVVGYTAIDDFTARDLQKSDPQWTRGKGFDTFCPVGPLATDEIDPWKGVRVETRVNGEVRQQGNTLDFLFALDVAIRYIAEVMTLFPGDLIATGTPEGVSPVISGDVVEVYVEGVGFLRNPIVDE